MLHVRERPRQPPPLERALAQYWRDHGASLPPLQCDDGSRLRVVYPGRASAAAGPDFRDAVLQRETGEVVRGDVELHLRRRGWEAHGHHTDSGYNGVVLHVVLHGGDTPIRLASGRRVPTAALFPRTLGTRARREAPAPRPLPLAALPTAPSRLARTLDREGDARFFLKVRGFAQALRQALQDGPFRTGSGRTGQRGPLGCALPRSDGRTRVRGQQRGDDSGSRRGCRCGRWSARCGACASEDRQALRSPRRCCRRAGFRNLDAAVDGDGAQGATPVVLREEWKLFRVRPSNHPSRRLLGMAALLDRAWDEGLASWSASLVAEGGIAGVRSALTVAVDGGGALIGADRASDLGGERRAAVCAGMGQPDAGRRALGEGAGALPRVAAAAGERRHAGGRAAARRHRALTARRCGARLDGSRG